jgi:hypothetical protein
LYDEFVTKSLWIAGQENAYKATPNRTYARFPKTALGLSQEQVDKIKASEIWYQKYMNTIIIKDNQNGIAPGMLGYKEICQRSAGHYDMQFPVFDKEEFFSCMIWMHHGCLCLQVSCKFKCCSHPQGYYFVN